jgi:hypothetical protein
MSTVQINRSATLTRHAGAWDLVAVAGIADDQPAGSARNPGTGRSSSSRIAQKRMSNLSPTVRLGTCSPAASHQAEDRPMPVTQEPPIVVRYLPLAQQQVIWLALEHLAAPKAECLRRQSHHRPGGSPPCPAPRGNARRWRAQVRSWLSHGGALGAPSGSPYDKRRMASSGAVA